MNAKGNLNLNEFKGAVMKILKEPCIFLSCTNLTFEAVTLFADNLMVGPVLSQERVASQETIVGSCSDRQVKSENVHNKID